MQTWQQRWLPVDSDALKHLQTHTLDVIVGAGRKLTRFTTFFRKSSGQLSYLIQLNLRAGYLYRSVTTMAAAKLRYKKALLCRKPVTTSWFNKPGRGRAVHRDLSVNAIDRTTTS
jgi:hypothetical protein